MGWLHPPPLIVVIVTVLEVTVVESASVVSSMTDIVDVPSFST